MDEPLPELGEMLHETHAGSSARSVTAFRALSMGSRSPRWMTSVVASSVSAVGIRVVRYGVENRRERGVADWKTGGGEAD